jgi:hypothetical protein
VFPFLGISCGSVKRSPMADMGMNGRHRPADHFFRRMSPNDGDLA